MALSLLTPPEVGEACQALRQAFQEIARIRTTVPGGRFVQFPKIPSLLSESWAALEISAGRAPFWEGATRVERGGAASDLRVMAADGSTSMVEVKATGSAGFQYFYAKDCATDVLVWLSFASAFEGNGDLSPTAYWLRNPKEVFDGPRKITLAEFRRRCEGRLIERKLAAVAS